MPMTSSARTGRSQRQAPRTRLSIMARSLSAPVTEAEDATAVGHSAPSSSETRISLREESSYALLGHVRCPAQLAFLRFLGRGMATSARRAEFTDSEVPNTSATSGSRTMSLVVRAIRPAYLPRTAFEKSYSARISSFDGLRLAFFILVPLALGREPCCDDTDSIGSFRMSHHKKAPAVREPHEKVSLLIVRMVGIPDRAREGIPEGSYRLVERNAVFPNILTSLLGVPLECKRQRLLLRSIGRMRDLFRRPSRSRAAHPRGHFAMRRGCDARAGVGPDAKACSGADQAIGRLSFSIADEISRSSRARIYPDFCKPSARPFRVAPAVDFRVSFAYSEVQALPSPHHPAALSAPSRGRVRGSHAARARSRRGRLRH